MNIVTSLKTSPESLTMTAPKIAFICGSLRTGSINQKLQAAMIKRFKAAGFSCSRVDLGKYDLPLYHGDLDTPANAKKLIDRIKKFDGVVVVTPEYNGSLPPLLKNAIDWTSTIGTDHFKQPYYGIAACTPGPMSGIMCMRQLNYILMRVGAHVSPIQVGTGNASKAFDAKGNLTSEPATSLLDKLIVDMQAQISK